MMNCAGVQAAEADGTENGIPAYKIDYQNRKEYHKEYQKRKRANRSEEERKKLSEDQKRKRANRSEEARLKLSEYQLQYRQQKNGKLDGKRDINDSRNANQFNNHRSDNSEQSYIRDSRTINHLNNNLLVNAFENERAGKAHLETQKVQYRQRKNGTGDIKDSRNEYQFNNHRSDIETHSEQSYVRDSRTINHLNNNLLVNALENERAGKALTEIHIRELERRNQDIATQKQKLIHLEAQNQELIHLARCNQEFEYVHNDKRSAEQTHQKQYTKFAQEWGWQMESIFQKIEEMDRRIEHMDRSQNKIIIEQKKEMDHRMDDIIIEQKKEMDHRMDDIIIEQKKEMDRRMDDIIALISEKCEYQLDVSEEVEHRMEHLIANHVEDLIGNHVEHEMDRQMEDLIADHKKEVDRQMEDLFKEMGRRMKDLNAEKGEKNLDMSEEISVRKTNSQRMQLRNNRRRQKPIRKKILYPSSFKIEAEEVKTNIDDMIFDFIEKNLLPFAPFCVPIVPFTNSCRMNYQSPQAMRIFFGRTKEQRKLRQRQWVERPIYGPMGVLKSTGPHPTGGLRVLPFTEEIDNIISAICKEIERRRRKEPNEPTQIMASNFDFNFMEIKIYVGKDVFSDENGKSLMGIDNEPLRNDCNKKVNLHNDLRFDDDANQHKDDTANGSHPTVTYTIGSARELTMVHVTKEREKKPWIKSVGNLNTTFTLDNGSLFILLPEDEIPKEDKNVLHKTKHEVHFSKDGLSFAFVFRSILKFSKFESDTNNWLWKEDIEYKHKVENYLRMVEKKHKKLSKDDRHNKIQKIEDRIRQMIKINRELKK